MQRKWMIAGLLVVGSGMLGCRSSKGVLNRLPSPLSPRQQSSCLDHKHSSQSSDCDADSGRSSRTTRSLSNAVIVIDPGHGGPRPGAWPKKLSKLPEETIVLDIGNKVVAGLRERGATVIPTRTTDRALASSNKDDLDRRAQIAESNHADLFVSIHADAATNKSANGIGIHTYTQASAESKHAAQSMLSAFNAAGISHWGKGIFPNNLHVLREHSRPALLIECGYLTNVNDAKKLNTSWHRTKIANAIVDGITRYFAD